jgi:hypothetical protein
MWLKINFVVRDWYKWKETSALPLLLLIPKLNSVMKIPAPRKENADIDMYVIIILSEINAQLLTSSNKSQIQNNALY